MRSREMKTPMKAIRGYCMECTYNQIVEIRECPSSESCPLWEYRLGHRPKEKAILTPMKAIHKKCSCCSETRKDVIECPITDCSLYSYRFGHRPK